MSGDLDLSRHRGAALAGAVVVVVVAVALVVLFGVEPYPDLPTVAEQPEPAVTARLAVRTWDRDGPCLRVVDGRGEVRELGCGPTFEGAGLEWISDDQLVVDAFPPLPEAAPDRPETVQVVDVETGEVSTVPTPPLDRSEDPAVRGDAHLRAGGLDGQVWVDVVEEGSTRRALTLDGPDSYALYAPVWSPDGRWLVVDDSAGRTLVAPVPGAGPADAPVRIWVEDQRGEQAVG